MRKLLLIIAFAYTAIGQAPKCPGAYHAVGSGCYTFPAITQSSWLDAVVFCQFSGGYLATIDSDAERSALLSYYYGSVNDNNFRWIGATDTASDGTWRWVPSGTTVVYNNWASGNPLLSTTKNCAYWAITTNGWYSIDCCDRYNNVLPLCEANPL